MKWTKEEIASSMETLKFHLKPGNTVYCNLRHVSKSGMSRVISLHTVADGHMLDMSFNAAVVMGDSLKESHGHRGIRADGCGMDMGFHLVYNLGRCMFPEGFGIEGEGPHGHKLRPASKELADKAVKKGWKFHGRNGDGTGWDTDGGYALKAVWI
jgi:hypothetical protein